MQQHNVSSPEELPLQFHTKPYIIKGREVGTQLNNQHTLVPAGAKRMHSLYRPPKHAQYHILHVERR